MGYFQVRYDSRVVNYDHRGFIRLATGLSLAALKRKSRLLAFKSPLSYGDAISRHQKRNVKVVSKTHHQIKTKRHFKTLV